MSTRRNHDAAFKACLAFEAPKGERTVSALATAYEVHPTMIHQWKKAVPKGASEWKLVGNLAQSDLDRAGN
jgi:transposase